MKKRIFNKIMIALICLGCNFVFKNEILAENPNYTIDYKTIFTRLDDNALVLVNDTNCRMKVTCSPKNPKTGEIYKDSSHDFTLAPGKYGFFYKPTTNIDLLKRQGINLKFKIKVEDVCKNKKKICRNAPSFEKTVPIGEATVFFIRRVNVKGCDKKPDLNEIEIQKIADYRGEAYKDGQAFIQKLDKFGKKHKTTVFIENNTTANVKGYMWYELVQKSKWWGWGKEKWYQGIINNGGNRVQISKDNYKDIKSCRVVYYRQEANGVYCHKKGVDFYKANGEDKINIKKNKENRLVFKYTHPNNKFHFNVTRK